MKKILLILLFLNAGLAWGAAYQCPQKIHCMYQGGQTVCDDLPVGWKVLQNLPPFITQKSEYNPSVSSWDLNSINYHSVRCSMVSVLSGTNNFTIDRDVSAPSLYPDVSDLWGWRWADENRTTANCNAPNQCKLLDSQSFAIVNTGEAQTITNKTVVGYATSADLTGGLATKYNIPSGTVSQVIRGDGTFTTLATVAYSGSYLDLTNRPSIPSGQIQSDWAQTDNTKADFIKNKPALGTASAQDVSYFATAAQGAKADSAIQPAALTSILSSYVTTSALTTALSGYATTSALSSGLAAKFNTPSGMTSQYLRGDGSLATFPSIPASQVQTDWNATTGLGVLLNKPVLAAVATSGAYADLIGKPALATVATTGSYNDLLNKPSIPSAQVQTDWNATSGLGVLLNKPNLATVATSGSYLDLINRPSIPSAQVNSDWSASTGVAQILNKPTTLAGYGITDAYPLTGNPSNFLTGITSLQVTNALGFTPYNATNPNGYIATAGARSAISLTTTGTSGVATYNSSTGVLNVPNYAVYAPTINNSVSRTLNSSFTVSATRACNVTYTVRIAYAVTAVLSSTGSIDLQYSTDSGATWTTVATVSNNINLGVVLSGYNDYELHGDNIPANALVRLNSVTTNATNTYRTGREVLI